jgi:hypothetical protein
MYFISTNSKEIFLNKIFEIKKKIIIHLNFLGPVRSNRTHKNTEILKKLDSVRFISIEEKSKRVSL